MFESKYLKNQALYRKAVKIFTDNFEDLLNESNLFSLQCSIKKSYLVAMEH